ncbi:MAG: inorganic phosphate transporter [Chitinophagaceae bacterium]|jgi:inorganic phosphate transporter, PiT family|nr:inorganic phosphate transporter [Chitinophagaceae bacterium]
MTFLIFCAVLLLTYANGANDNFKGTATLWGSGTLNYKQALLLATLFTFAGSLCSFFLANGLVKNFSGKGLVPDEILQTKEFVLAVAGGTGITILLATFSGFPVSTTHGLVGALVGAGIVASGRNVDFSVLGKTFFLPLLISPLIAIMLTGILYKISNTKKKPHYALSGLTLTNNGSLINPLHFLSAGVVSFARGLNDTPKLISLLLLSTYFSLPINFLLLAIVMATGGLINARKIAETMSKKITSLSPQQGLLANMVTGTLVIVASKFGLPVSTTHVSVGSIYGIGLFAKTANTREIAGIGLSWLLTLPIAALISATIFLISSYIH